MSAVSVLLHLHRHWIQSLSYDYSFSSTHAQWYILSAFGFYPVNPPSGTYAVGAPMFERVSISLPPGGPNGVMGKKLVISSPGATAKPYVKSLKLNGKNIDKATLSHRQIVNGGLLEFEMSSERTSWG